MKDSLNVDKEESFQEELDRVPVVNWFVRLLISIRIPGLDGMSLYRLLEMYGIGIVKGALTSRAGGISYSFFMAVFPFLLFILTLIAYIPIDGFQESLFDLIRQAMPPKTFDAVEVVLKDIINNKQGGLLSFGFIGSIFLMTNGVNAVFGAFEYSVHVKELRSVVKQYLISLGTTLTISLMLILTIASIIFFEYGLDFMHSKGWLPPSLIWLSKLRLFILLFMIFCTIALLYYYGTKEGKVTSFFSPGAIMSTLLSLLTFYGFGVYVEKFATYNVLYGPIGTLMILMLFIWLNSTILLLGFELNASVTRLRNEYKEGKMDFKD